MAVANNISVSGSLNRGNGDISTGPGSSRRTEPIAVPWSEEMKAKWKEDAILDAARQRESDRVVREMHRRIISHQIRCGIIAGPVDTGSLDTAVQGGKTTLERRARVCSFPALRCSPFDVYDGPAMNGAMTGRGVDNGCDSDCDCSCDDRNDESLPEDVREEELFDLEL